MLAFKLLPDSVKQTSQAVLNYQLLFLFVSSM